jgi:hypothetical protein
MKPAIACLKNTATRVHSLQMLLFLLLSLFSLNTWAQEKDLKEYAVLRMNEVNSRAARHFLDNFSPSTSVKWFKDEKHYVASFGEADSTDRVYYKDNGDFDFCIKYFHPEALDQVLKSTVLKRFPGCEIMVVTEFTDLEKTDLYIKIKDGSYIRTLSCSDGGIEVMENIKNIGS